MDERPDILDLLDERFDQPGDHRKPPKKLIICAAPRTGSFELGRLLLAAQVGIAHEYFHPSYAKTLASRWRIVGNPLASDQLGNYVNELLNRRQLNNVFAVKLQYWQLDSFLRNEVGAELLDDATFVHLFRSNISEQLLSYIFAKSTGRWGFSPENQTAPASSADDDIKIRDMLELILNEDSGFRRTFAQFGVSPLFATTDELENDPVGLTMRIAQSLGVTTSKAPLEEMAARSARYPPNVQSVGPFADQVTTTLRRLRSGAFTGID